MWMLLSSYPRISFHVRPDWQETYTWVGFQRINCSIIFIYFFGIPYQFLRGSSYDPDLLQAIHPQHRMIPWVFKTNHLHPGFGLYGISRKIPAKMPFCRKRPAVNLNPPMGVDSVCTVPPFANGGWLTAWTTYSLAKLPCAWVAQVILLAYPCSDEV